MGWTFALFAGLGAFFIWGAMRKTERPSQLLSLAGGVVCLAFVPMTFFDAKSDQFLDGTHWVPDSPASWAFAILLAAAAGLGLAAIAATSREVRAADRESLAAGEPVPDRLWSRGAASITAAGYVAGLSSIIFIGFSMMAGRIDPMLKLMLAQGQVDGVNQVVTLFTVVLVASALTFSLGSITAGLFTFYLQGRRRTAAHLNFQRRQAAFKARIALERVDAIATHNPELP